ncbi:hypothetical protein [Spirosoma spitsbergense]|uniref:hypothetical protein n=1 Tax=Spirosoma spitsbergense TaxID=431554 RepID=UPI0003A555DA|nr:hypothetical protein [Spirosoma spitsbergense]
MGSTPALSSGIELARPPQNAHCGGYTAGGLYVRLNENSAKLTGQHADVGFSCDRG